jgi:TRAP-type C4-dicarboxylate transport system permease small subunit
MSEKPARILAIAGGLLLLATAIMVTWSVVLTTFFKSNVQGDFEMAQMANAIAIFAFLPLAQARSGHVFVDTFTGWVNPRVNELLDSLWTFVMFAVLAMIAYRTLIGALDSYKSNMQTMVLLLPQAPPIFICGLLAAVSAIYAFFVGLKLLRGSK